MDASYKSNLRKDMCSNSLGTSCPTKNGKDLTTQRSLFAKQEAAHISKRVKSHCRPFWGILAT
eukprot:6480921-Amphidinium_carterae.1